MPTRSQLIVSAAIGVVLGLGLILTVQPSLLSGARSASPVRPGTMKVVHVVRPGESLQQIAELHNIRPGAIVIANHVSDLDPPEPGTQLVVPVIEPTSTPRKSPLRGMTTAGTALGRAGDPPLQSDATRTPSSSSVVSSTPVDPVPSPAVNYSDEASTAVPGPVPSPGDDTGPSSLSAATVPPSLSPGAAETPDIPADPPQDPAGMPAKEEAAQDSTAGLAVNPEASPTRIAAPGWRSKSVDEALALLSDVVALDAPSVSAIASRPGAPGKGQAKAVTSAAAHSGTSAPAPAVSIASLHPPTSEATDGDPTATPDFRYSERRNTPEPEGEAVLSLVVDGIVMAWPHSGSHQLGILPAGSVVPTNGRLEDRSWWEVPYPGGPNGNGWLQASVVRPNVAASSVPAYSLATASPTPTTEVADPAATAYTATPAPTRLPH